jgi:7-carboxy-7-deazaguanine synthase
MEANMLEVSETFVSLQGEGPFAGRPAVFVRLAGCVPPFCEWCDTPQALGSGRRMSVEDIEGEIARHPRALVVITGGEPFLQWGTGLERLARALGDSSRQVQYETSGKAGIPADHGGFVVCSPKPLHAPVLDPDAASRVDAFKFVVEEDITPVLDFIAAHGIDSRKVWLMPLGATRQDQMRRMAPVWELCVRHGFNFSARLHVLTFNDKRGV